MNTRPLQVFCGSINTTESSNAFPNFNYFEISDDIAVATYSYTGEHNNLPLKYPDNPVDNSLIIQVFKTKCPFSANSEKNDFVNVAFVLKGISSLLEDGQLTSEDTLDMRFNSESITQIVLPELVASHLSLLEIKTTQEKIKQVHLRGWAYQLAYAITEAMSHLFTSNTINQFKQSDIQKIRQLGYSLKSNLHKSSPSLDDMAKMAEMSPTKFKTIFKEVLGMSPHQYILNLKLNHAQYLLKHQSLSVSEVAYKVGFNHPSALTRLFQSKLGVAPNMVLSRN
ncbi:MAG: helix-turn-helix transcriptional regulator [Bacteroidota bacterium]|jgi:AraC-like DNA-binding protein